MKSLDQIIHTETSTTPEKERERFLQFGKFTRDCPQWILDKVAKIDNTNVDEKYVEKVLNIIAEEFDSEKHQTTSTNDIKKSRFTTVSDILAKRQASCGSKATVVASVLRSLKIPTKLIHGLYVKNNPNMRHAWNEVSLKDEWMPFDITRVAEGYKLGEFHIKKSEALDWDEFEQNTDKF